MSFVDIVKRYFRMQKYDRIVSEFSKLGFIYIDDCLDHVFSKKVLLDNGRELDHRLEFMTRSNGEVSMASYSYNDPDNPSNWFNIAYNLTFDEIKVCKRMMAWLKKYHSYQKPYSFEERLVDNEIQ